MRSVLSRTGESNPCMHGIWDLRMHTHLQSLHNSYPLCALRGGHSVGPPLVCVTVLLPPVCGPSFSCPL